MQTKFVTIVTMMYNKHQLTRQLLLDLFKHERDNIDQIIIVDDGSSEQEWARLNVMEGCSEFTVWRLRNPSNLGFTLSANAGLKLAAETKENNHLVYLISNDVRIFGKFIERSAEFLLSPRKHLVGNTLIAHNSGWNRFGDKIFPYLDGSFLAATASDWGELGYFDEAYAPGDFEDVSLSTFARIKGYKLIPLNNPSIVHLGGGTTGYSAEREVITRRNQEYFRRKWAE